MEKEMYEKRSLMEKIFLYILMAMSLILFFLLLRNILGGKNMQKNTLKASSDLINTSDIAILSTSEFVYNGIAQSLNENGKPEYNVLYKSTVKAGIDAGNINYAIDEDNKTIIFHFKEIRIEDPLIDINSISFIPEEMDLYMDDVIKLCRNDALNEASRSGNLIEIARENIQSITEAWYSRVLEGYSFKYVFNDGKGGEG